MTGLEVCRVSHIKVISTLCGWCLLFLCGPWPLICSSQLSMTWLGSRSAPKQLKMCFWEHICQAKRCTVHSGGRKFLQGVWDLIHEWKSIVRLTLGLGICKSWGMLQTIVFTTVCRSWKKYLLLFWTAALEGGEQQFVQIGTQTIHTVAQRHSWCCNQLNTEWDKGYVKEEKRVQTLHTFFVCLIVGSVL